MKTPNVTVEEAVNKKRNLELLIEKACIDYCQETGLEITYIDINLTHEATMDQPHPRLVAVRCEVDVRLPSQAHWRLSD